VCVQLGLVLGVGVVGVTGTRVGSPGVFEVGHLLRVVLVRL